MLRSTGKQRDETHKSTMRYFREVQVDAKGETGICGVGIFLLCIPPIG